MKRFFIWSGSIVAVIVIIAIVASAAGSSDSGGSNGSTVLEKVGENMVPYPDKKRITVDPSNTTFVLGDVLRFNDIVFSLKEAKVFPKGMYEHEMFQNVQGDASFLDIKVEALNMTDKPISIMETDFALLNGSEVISGAAFYPGTSLKEVKNGESQTARITFKMPPSFAAPYEVVFYFTSKDGKNTPVKFKITPN